MNFQAAVTAIAFVHMARGRQLGWLEGLVDDVPVAVDAETDGAGDDIRLLLGQGKTVEVQVKKGLRATTELWDAMLKLAAGVTGGSIDFGLLIVSPTSSGTITRDLARDVARIGEGRSDGLSAIAVKLVGKLRAKGIDPKAACARLRIQTVHALAADQASATAAKAEFAHLLDDETQIAAAWNTLTAEAMRLIERRGRRDLAGLLAALNASGIRITAASAAPLALLGRLTRWTGAANATYTIVGVDRPLSVEDAWIDLTAIVREDSGAEEKGSLEEALRKYQDWESRGGGRDVQSVDPETLGRFVTETVLVAGPGMGKTTLLKRIARRYSGDGIPVLKVRLSAVATRMRSGDTFEEAMFSLGLDGSGISPAETRAAGFRNWTLLCDGLDECGAMQEQVADGVMRFAAGHPGSRIIVTTRPIGYRAAHFGDWRHYDLPALSYSDAYASAARLLDVVIAGGPTEGESAWDISRRELFNTPAAKIVGRTPLMLSLAVAVMARGRSLPESRERLYEVIFELIDDAPNARIPEPPAPASVLRGFLNVLGWTLTERPLDTIDDTLERGAAWLTEQLGTRPLAAAAAAETYLEYWEHVGMVERVGHAGREVLSFIHKSFGEFAAARHLRALTPSDITAAIARILNEAAWAEVLRFAGLLGLAEEVATGLSGAADARQIAFAVELIADGKPPPQAATRSVILTAAVGIVAGDRRGSALLVEAPLVRASSAHPGEAAPLLAAHLDSGQPWTRLVAWACAVTAGPAHYALDDLIDALPEVVRAIEPSIKQGLGGGLMLGGGADRDIGEAFVLAAFEEILDRASTDVADDLARTVLDAEQLGSSDFVQRANRLLKAKGRSYVVGSSYSIDTSLFDVPDGYHEAFSAMWEAVFEALELPPPSEAEVAQATPPLLYLSAFIEASAMHRVVAGDTWGWSRPFDPGALRETLLAFVHVIGVDREKLREEAIQARAYLATEKARRFSSLYELTSSVDPPPAAWSRVRELEVDPALIEAAIRHPSQWVKWVAANLLEELLPKHDLTLAVERLLETGRGYTLWAAAGLAVELVPEEAARLVLARLAKPLVPGCGHLFDLLAQMDAPASPDLASVIRDGLLADVRTAIAAAELAIKFEVSASATFATTLERAYAHWLVNEEPYPEKGGAIPDSPRATILAALGRISCPAYADIKRLLSDPRSDVTKYANEALAERMRLPDGERSRLIADVNAGEMSAHALHRLLREGIPLDAAERAAAEGLLDSPSVSVRFNAMALLDERYMDRDRIRVRAETLSRDHDERISDRAFAILEGK